MWPVCYLGKMSGNGKSVTYETCFTAIHITPLFYFHLYQNPFLQNFCWRFPICRWYLAVYANWVILCSAHMTFIKKKKTLKVTEKWNNKTLVAHSVKILWQESLWQISLIAEEMIYRCGYWFGFPSCEELRLWLVWCGGTCSSVQGGKPFFIAPWLHRSTLPVEYNKALS